MAEGYAINEVGAGGILVDSVHATRRAAIVHWLRTHRNTPVTADRSDDWVEFMWKHLRSEMTFCIRVEISAVQGAAANVTERDQ